MDEQIDFGLLLRKSAIEPVSGSLMEDALLAASYAKDLELTTSPDDTSQNTVRDGIVRHDSVAENLNACVMETPRKPTPVHLSSQKLAFYEHSGQVREPGYDEVLGLHKFDDSCVSQWSVSSPASSFDISPSSPILGGSKTGLAKPVKMGRRKRSQDVRAMLKMIRPKRIAAALQPILRLPQSPIRSHHGTAPPVLSRASFLEPDSVLVLSLRCGKGGSRIRTTTLTVPVFYTPANQRKDRESRSLSFDDEALFVQIRHQYSQLCGPWRLYGARSLTRIVVQGRSPRDFAKPGDDDTGTCTEAQLFEYFNKPSLGRGRYAFVQWARRIANVPALHILHNDEFPANTNAIEMEGLEFVLAWSLPRIIAAAVLVLIATVFIPLIWSLAATDAAATGDLLRHEGSHGHAGTGALIGFCIFLIGVGGMGGWLGLSRLAM